MVRRRSTVRFRNGAPHQPAKTAPHLRKRGEGPSRVLRLATAHTGWLRLAVPNTCPSFSRPFGLVWRVSLGSVGVAERVFDAPLGYLVLAAKHLA